MKIQIHNTKIEHPTLDLTKIKDIAYLVLVINNLKMKDCSIIIKRVK